MSLEGRDGPGRRRAPPCGSFLNLLRHLALPDREPGIDPLELPSFERLTTDGWSCDEGSTFAAVSESACAKSNNVDDLAGQGLQW